MNWFFLLKSNTSVKENNRKWESIYALFKITVVLCFCFGGFFFVLFSFSLSIGAFIVWEQNSVCFWHPSRMHRWLLGHLFFSFACVNVVWFRTMEDLCRCNAFRRPVSVAGRWRQAEGIKAVLQDIWLWKSICLVSVCIYLLPIKSCTV